MIVLRQVIDEARDIVDNGFELFADPFLQGAFTQGRLRLLQLGEIDHRGAHTGEFSLFPDGRIVQQQRQLATISHDNGILVSPGDVARIEDFLLVGHGQFEIFGPAEAECRNAAFNLFGGDIEKLHSRKVDIVDVSLQVGFEERERKVLGQLAELLLAFDQRGLAFDALGNVAGDAEEHRFSVPGAARDLRLHRYLRARFHEEGNMADGFRAGEHLRDPFLRLFATLRRMDFEHVHRSQLVERIAERVDRGGVGMHDSAILGKNEEHVVDGLEQGFEIPVDRADPFLVPRLHDGRAHMRRHGFERFARILRYMIERMRADIEGGDGAVFTEHR